MNTTLNIIKSKHPCIDGWVKLISSLNKTRPDDEPISLETILKSNGIKDAVWCLSCFDYKDYCLFLADVAESVLSIFESKYPDDGRPRRAIEAIRLYRSNNITKDHLRDAYAAADDDAAYAYAAANAANAANADVAVKNKWLEIEKLFIQYFC